MKRHFGLLIAVLLLLTLAMPLAAQDETDISVTLTPYEGNPVLTAGESGAWDASGVGFPRVTYADGMYHMFYSGWRSVELSVGYATSEDGLSWTKYDNNPIFTLEDRSARRGVISQYTMLDGDTWVMYFTPSAGNGPSDNVMRATAPSPTGPWIISPDPVLTVGAQTDWDFYDGLEVDSVLQTDDGYILYYTLLQGQADTGPFYNGGGIGRAVSTDGAHWVKYDDPLTTEEGLSASDPVFVTNAEAWDAGLVALPTVLAGDGILEMFYGGTGYVFQDVGYGTFAYPRIGYATSADGISWTRYADAPVLTAEDEGFSPSSVLVSDGNYHLYYTHYTKSTNTIDISVALGTITRE